MVGAEKEGNAHAKRCIGQPFSSFGNSPIIFSGDPGTLVPTVVASVARHQHFCFFRLQIYSVIVLGPTFCR